MGQIDAIHAQIISKPVTSPSKINSDPPRHVKEAGLQKQDQPHPLVVLVVPAVLHVVVFAAHAPEARAHLVRVLRVHRGVMIKLFAEFGSGVGIGSSSGTGFK